MRREGDLDYIAKSRWKIGSIDWHEGNCLKEDNNGLNFFVGSDKALGSLQRHYHKGTHEAHFYDWRAQDLRNSGHVVGREIHEIFLQISNECRCDLYLFGLVSRVGDKGGCEVGNERIFERGVEGGFEHLFSDGKANWRFCDHMRWVGTCAWIQATVKIIFNLGCWWR